MDQDGRDQTQLDEEKLAEAASDDVESQLRRRAAESRMPVHRDRRRHRARPGENVVPRSRQSDGEHERRREVRLPVQDSADRRLRHGQNLRRPALQVRHVRRTSWQHHRRRLYDEDRPHRRQENQGARSSRRQFNLLESSSDTI